MKKNSTPSLQRGLLIIALLLLTVFLFDHFSKETITSAAYSDRISGAVASGRMVSGNGITGASHVPIINQIGLEKFKIQMHDAFEAYVLSAKTPQNKTTLINATENALDALYTEAKK